MKRRAAESAFSVMRSVKLGVAVADQLCVAAADLQIRPLA